MENLLNPQTLFIVYILLCVRLPNASFGCERNVPDQQIMSRP
jgi:hypothetical protein